VVLSAFGAIPFVISSLDMSYTDAFFEATSGLTTTGATVIGNLDGRPPGILLWRSILQWLGGLGIIVMAVAVLPVLQVGGMQIFKVEAFDTSDKILPRATQISGALTGVYLALTIICAISYALAGMNNFDAIVHSMTTVATGGMSSHDASIGYFDSVVIEVICVIFMILGSLPFLLYVSMVQGNRLAMLTDAQVRGFFIILASAIYLAWVSQVSNGENAGLSELRNALFSVVSIMTGSGFAVTDYGQWSAFAVTLFFFIMFIGGCSGSTSCGIKIFRFQVILESIRTHTRRLIYPSGVFMPSYNGRNLPYRAITSVMSFMFAFIVCLLLVSFILTLFGLDNITAFSATASALANVGPGLGDIVGPVGNYSSLPDGVKWILSATMLMGRLEIFAILVFFLPDFWR
jgi:trk system potassium uptake protein TrkH